MSYLGERNSITQDRTKGWNCPSFFSVGRSCEIEFDKRIFGVEAFAFIDELSPVRGGGVDRVEKKDCRCRRGRKKTSRNPEKSQFLRSRAWTEALKLQPNQTNQSPSLHTHTHTSPSSLGRRRGGNEKKMNSRSSRDVENGI